MNVYRIYIYLYCWFVFLPLCWWLTKRGRKILSLYMHIWVFAYIEFMHLMFYKIRRMFLKVKTKRGRRFLEKEFWIYACFSHLVDAYICLASCTSLLYLYVYCYAWVKGELLWSLTLIHAYITPWVLSSSKRGRLLAQRPITLVLMMINSCSYVY